MSGNFSAAITMAIMVGAVLITLFLMTVYYEHKKPLVKK